MSEFDYIIPSDVDEALNILKRKKNITVLAGGTDVIPLMKDGFIKPEIILDISGLKKLKFIRKKNNNILIGPLTTHTELCESQTILKYAGILSKSASEIAAVQIRNAATVGGNIGNASPAGDTIPALYVLNAKIELSKKDSKREVKIDKFFTGPKSSVMGKDELITAVKFKAIKNNEKYFFMKLGQRKALAIAKVSVACVLTINSGIVCDPKIALGAVAPTVIYAKKTEEFLNGKKLNRNNIKKAAEIICKEAKPIDDIRSNRNYRKEMVGELLKRGLNHFK